MKKNHAQMAARVFRQKIDLERKMVPELKTYFNQIARSVAGGSEKIQTVRPILEKQNKRVGQSLVKQGKNKELRTKLIDGAIKNNLKKITEHSLIIDTYTKELLRRSKDAAKELLTEAKKDEKGFIIALEFKADSKSLNKTTANILNNYNQNRIHGVVVTETNNYYEAGKRNIYENLQPHIIEAVKDDDIDELDDVNEMFDSSNYLDVQTATEAGKDKDQIFELVTNPTHIWATMGDDKVRETHSDADGQEQPIDQPFDVGDSQMMFPGDDSLGADVEEIANCRCSEIL